MVTYCSVVTSCSMRAMGNSGARSSGPTGCSVPGCSTGGGGLGRSGTMLYQLVGISDSDSRILVASSLMTSIMPPRPPVNGRLHPFGGRYAGRVTSASPTRRRDAARTRQALLEAARHRFAGDGYAATTVRDIADDAGVNVALISRYFQSKEGLFEACLTSAVDDMKRAAGTATLAEVPERI